MHTLLDDDQLVKQLAKKKNWHKTRCSLPLVALFLTFLMSTFCTADPASSEHGDAQVIKYGARYFPWEMGRAKGYAISLPDVSLAKIGTTHFHVASLPVAVYEYRLELSGGLHYHDHHAPPLQSYRFAHVSIRFSAPNGTILFKLEQSLDSPHWLPDGSKVYQDILMPLHDDFPLAHATDYQVSVTVSHPSEAPNEVLRITGFGPAN